MTKPIHVIGHRNPDTDSICAAIGYAHLKQSLGEDVIPARAGKINAETKFVLEHFGASAPELINDLYPRVKDVMAPTTATIHPWETIREFGKIMKQHCVKSVPVVEADNTLVGIVSVGDLAKRYFDELEMQDLSEAGVSFDGVLRALEGKLICGEDLQRKVTGKVRIAAARTLTATKMIDAGDIVLVGDRGKAQLACLNRGIACLVVTGGAEVSSSVVETAKSRGIIVMTTPYDTYMSARLVNQSIPVRMIMYTDVVAFKPTQLVSDIKETIVQTNHRNYPVTENGKLLGRINRGQLIVPEREKIILVDHNEHGQAVEGIEEAQIDEIIDHHRLGGLQTGEPIFIRHEPVGSTSTIVANMHWHRNVEIPTKIAGLLLAAILSDTVLFKSPTATAIDRETAARLAAIAGLDIQEFGMQVLKAGSGLNNLSTAEILHNDLKEFDIGEDRVAISQVSVMDSSDVLTLKNELIAFMSQMQVKENYDMVVLLVTDIMAEGTYLLYAGQHAGLLVKAFGEQLENGVFYLPGVMSRKKQVVPPMVEAARS
jgi:manganese-dependent inorganic pyrophosphatase